MQCPASIVPYCVLELNGDHAPDIKCDTSSNFALHENYGSHRLFTAPHLKGYGFDITLLYQTSGSDKLNTIASLIKENPVFGRAKLKLPSSMQGNFSQIREYMEKLISFLLANQDLYTRWKSGIMSIVRFKCKHTCKFTYNNEKEEEQLPCINVPNDPLDSIEVLFAQ